MGPCCVDRDVALSFVEVPQCDRGRVRGEGGDGRHEGRRITCRGGDAHLVDQAIEMLFSALAIVAQGSKISIGMVGKLSRLERGTVKKNSEEIDVIKKAFLVRPKKESC